MKLTDVKESFDDLKDDVVLEIKNNKYIEYVTELKNEAKIKDYYDNL
jgi:hypothetical protein